MILQSIEQKIQTTTLNNRQTYLSSVFNELGRFDEINYSDPLDKLRTIKIVERELSYLTDDDINALLKAVKPNAGLYHATLLCLTCGLRWGEAGRIDKKDIKNGKVSVFGKNGKYRHIPLRKDIADILEFPIKATKNAFAIAYKNSGVKKVEGQSTHILRHTFASHFIMNGGDILSLQKILDHSSLNMTMRYAHLSPNHLQDALKFAPVVNLLS
jgi:integrase